MFVAVAFLLASPAAPRFYSYEHADNSHGRWNDTASFLGLVYNADDCQQVCIDRFGGDATKGCTAWTFYHAGHYKSEVRRHCYGDHATGTWAPFYSSLDAPSEWGNVTSGQNEPASFVTPCSSRDDCSYNGHCSDAGVCECYPQWMGKHCGQLHLIPTPKSSGLESTDGGGRVSSWGGSPVRGDTADGSTYHMFAAEMTHNTGIVVWMSNSRIRHAISTTGPAGPYKAHDVSFPVWGHEPTVARAPTGEYAMFWSASFGKDVPCSRVQCPNGDNGNSVIDGEQCLPDTDCVYRPPMRSYMAYAAGPAGPWSAPQLVASPEGEEGDQNFAPLIRADGSLIALGRPPYIWRADDWRNATSYAVEAVEGGTVDGEDPFLYIDPRDPTVLHALSHAGGWDSSGGHVWSADGGQTWGRHTDVAAYGSLILYDDSTSVSLSRRERPHLAFDKDGLPTALTNGATAVWPCTHPETCPHDHCYTSLQRLNMAHEQRSHSIS